MAISEKIIFKKTLQIQLNAEFILNMFKIFYLILVLTKRMSDSLKVFCLHTYIYYNSLSIFVANADASNLYIS